MVRGYSLFQGCVPTNHRLCRFVQYQSETNKGDEMTEVDFELLDFLVECMFMDRRAACESAFIAGALGYLVYKYKDAFYEAVEIIKKERAINDRI